MSTLCNLKCTYCYQNGSEKLKEIEDITLDATLKYLERIFKYDSKMERVNVGFIGGEPLLYKEQVIKVIEAVIKICDKHNKSII